ncbi:HAUS augmin-like complex subunit 8 [Conger conger]|uniref:HAUS augmin-like complex subunit 8 n=1 Tax=Conger conger TaxID=82655 RepID=UPI002A59AA82|nr:HAUS augmin-like complex subunit 8 [Conger conger]
MASRRLTTIHKLQKPVLGESNNSKDGSQNNSGNIGDEKRKKKPAGKIVKSRYQQAAEKKPLLKTSATESNAGLRPASPKPGSARKPCVSTPPRRSLACQSLLNPLASTSSILEPSILGGNVLQSTVLDGHCVHPEFDVSVIGKDKSQTQHTAESGNEKEILENQAFLLAYLTAKMESNTRELRSEAEWSLLAVMEEEERLRKSVCEKRRRHLLLEKHRQFGELLDLQTVALGPVSAASGRFTEEYRAFATALDTTRHQLPVRNFHIPGDRRHFLGLAEASLRGSEALLLGDGLRAQPGGQRALELLEEMKRDTVELEQQLSRDFSDVLELSSLVSRQTVQVQQTLEEQSMGASVTRALYLPEP